MGVQVFDHDIYTVVLSQNAGLIPDALKLVKKDRRPALNQPLFDWYGRIFPNWPIALCCFNNRQQAAAAPLTIWYEPLRGDFLTLPAIDCHTGATPRLSGRVEVDHWVIYGRESHAPGFARVHYRRPVQDPFLAKVLPSYVVGQRFTGQLMNDDFIVDTESHLIERGRLTV